MYYLIIFLNRIGLEADEIPSNKILNNLTNKTHQLHMPGDQNIHIV